MRHIGGKLNAAQRSAIMARLAQNAGMEIPDETRKAAQQVGVGNYCVAHRRPPTTQPHRPAIRPSHPLVACTHSPPSECPPFQLQSAAVGLAQAAEAASRCIILKNMFDRLSEEAQSNPNFFLEVAMTTDLMHVFSSRKGVVAKALPSNSRSHHLLSLPRC